MSARSILSVAVGVLCLPLLARAGDWPQFRGPDGAGLSSDKQLPAEWGADKNVAWKIKIPGYGWSSPIAWGDKVFVTTATSEKQKKPSAFAGFGGPRGGGAGAFRPPQPGQILAPFVQEQMELSAKQKKQTEELQKEVDGKLAKLLDEKQKKKLKETGGGFGRGGPRGGPPRFGGFPQPGQVLSPAVQASLELTAKQKKQLEEIQKEVDGKLAKVLSDKQQKQLKEMRGGLGRGGFGGFGNRKPPDEVFRWEVYCLSAADGSVLWQKTAVSKKPAIPKHSSNTYATETPVTDGKRVYAYFGMVGVFCYDFSGKLLWKVDLGAYPIGMGNGTGSSPALADGRLFIQCDNEEKSFLVALDAKTGDELWRVKRTERTGWSTPLIWKNKQRTEIVCLGTPRARSYDPATGKQLWELGGMTGQAKASPVAGADLLYIGTGGGFGGFGGFGGGPPADGGRQGGGPSADGGRQGGGRFGGGGRPLFAVKAGATGDLTLKNGAKSNDGIAWSLPQAGPPTASPLLLEGRLYILEERGGLLSCYNANTGKQIYKERLAGARGFTSSPWAYAGKLFCLDDSGQTFVVDAGPKFKLLRKNALDEMFWSSPAVAGGTLLLRGVDHLYCIKQAADKPKS
jgi:outer membrane protein assembly factor BamB